MDIDFDDEVNDFFDHENVFNNEAAVDEEDTVPTDDQVLNDLFGNENKLVGKNKKRVVLRPQPKLNEAIITGPKGIKSLKESFRDFKPNINKDPVYMMKSRLDMPLEDEDFVPDNNIPNDKSQAEEHDTNTQLSNDSFDD
uniref:TIMELESS-interacting protein n=1 Tax=Heterorhabditis bacteriophora TaxID=37862 RepID=A0A1I7WVK7_HETBA